MLNKKGWGLREMLVLSAVLIIFLMVAIYYIYRLYGDLNRDLNNNYYYDLEAKLEGQARVYIDDYLTQDLDNNYLTITRGNLRNYNLDVELKDKDGKACSGYVKANKDEINGYIKCEDYETDGYESWRE